MAAPTRANVEKTKAFIRERLGNAYVYGGALSPTAVKQGTDCSEVWQTVLEMVHGRYVPGRQAEGATTETHRIYPDGKPIPVGGVGPFGTIRVARPQDIPANAAAKLAFHHGGGGANSHMWGELDGMRIESRGGGVGLITQPRAMAINDPYANAWAYLPGPIAEDGTPPAPEVVLLGQRYENAGDRVRQLQAALNTQGAGLDVDGEFGPKTEQAVRNYQRANGLEVDGVAGPVTLAALGLKLGTSTTPNTAPADTVALLRRAMERTDQTNARLAELLPHFAEAMRAAEINTLNRAAAWCSQIGHESAGLKYMAEIQTDGPGWSEDRRRYRGRGPIQLTWSSNYRKFGQWCASRGYVTDPELFVRQPELVEQPRWGFLAASWYWLNAGPRPGRINAYADAGDILAVSRCVNGWIEGQDPVGWADRRARWLNCLAIGDQLLTLATPSVPTDPFEELLMSNLRVPSLSIYANPGEPDIPIVDMIRALDAHGSHEEYVERQALLGDADALARIARTAAGRGKYGTAPFAVNQARAALAKVEAANPAALEQYLADQKGA